MGAANITPRNESPTHFFPPQRSYSASCYSYSLTQLSTIRLICRTDIALHAFLCFIDDEKRKNPHNLIRGFSYLEPQFIHSYTKIEKNMFIYQNYSTYSHLIHDDPTLSLNFLRQLESTEKYLIVASVICVLNDFIQSEWHKRWQQIEMQSIEPSPQIFPTVCETIHEKFTLHDHEFQYFLKTSIVSNSFELLINCLKHLPIPLVVMEISTGKQWFPITTVNTAFEEMTGYREEDIKGLTLKELNSNLDLESIYQIRNEIIQGQISRMILPFTRHNGEAMTCVFGVIPIFGVNRSITSFLTLIDDISSSNYCLLRLKFLSDFIESISCDLNLSPSDENPFCGSPVGNLI